ncbi:S8 family serine peptidase [Rhabdaerophilum sp. SD176]|uniref:S8 family serine peptidase n=1 Tax=Rhabdaerophilum sp. SD176 TaxID=2983548 RepID=UPI0024DF371D|nr:S8 family serine peptidase [Rhabdaerophilum sp. SD176]
MIINRILDLTEDLNQSGKALERQSLAPKSQQWHLANEGQNGGKAGIDLNIEAAWEDYRGAGARVLVVDEAVDTSVAALVKNGEAMPTLGLSAADRSAMQKTGSGYHGTSVAGLIGGSGEGGALGVAPEAELTSLPIFNRSVGQMTTQLKAMVDYDIANHSWGWKTGFYDGAGTTAWQNFHATFEEAAVNGREGLGTILVFAAGNSGALGADTNASLMTSSRYAIAVGAVTDLGERAQYTTGGASLFISAPSSGGKKGITTSDTSGSYGAQSGDINPNFGGTSAAAPQVSGVIALMLEANPHLAWRDVQDILALSARQLDLEGSKTISATTNGATHWNGGGLRFSNDVGFGLVDATAAVRLAETWLSGKSSANELSVEEAGTGPTAHQYIDNFRSGSLTFTVESGMSVEKIVLDLDFTHDRASDLVITLVSPDGTKSLLLDEPGYSGKLPTWSFSSNAFRGELSEGTWTVTIEDRAPGGAGMLHGGSLYLYGAEETSDTVYVFTNDFAELVKLDASRAELADDEGYDILNLAAVSSDLVIDLSARSESRIDGEKLILLKETWIEAAFAGDGDDHLTAHDQGGLLVGGRGDDTLLGGSGDDYLEGGLGSNKIEGGLGKDTAIYRLAREAVTFETVEEGWIIATGEDEDLVRDVEVFAFSDGLLTFDIMDSEAAQIYRLYEATFGRDPDEMGLVHWTKVAMTGQSLETLARGFVHSDEFEIRYGANVTHAEFVGELYENVLGREAGDAEIDHWVLALNQGLAREDALVGFSESLEHRILRAEELKNGIWLPGQDWLQ